MKKLVIIGCAVLIAMSVGYAKTLEEVLISKDENLLISGIETAEDDVKVKCIDALGEKQTAGTNAIRILRLYSGYGLTYAVANRFNQGGSWKVRRASALALAKLKAEEAVVDLVTVLRQERRPDVKVAIVYALGEIGSPKAVNVLLDQLRFASEQNIIYSAVIALGKIGDRRAFVELLNIAQNEKNFDVVRQAAVDALDKINW